MSRWPNLPALFMAGLLAAACGSGEAPRPWPDQLPVNPEDGNHFDGVTDPFYEGWYHKVAIPGQEEAFFFIYGVINPLPDTSLHSEAFMYCGRQKTQETVYQSFPARAYWAAYGNRNVQIGDDNRACALRIKGKLIDGLHRCEWDIDLDQGRPWMETMGWLTGTSGLETSWTVGGITAQASGWVKFDGETIRFEDQKGYGDHNWGSIFPESWIWMQANDFPGQDASLAASGGTVDLGTNAMEAYMVGLQLGDQMVTFRTQDLDQFTATAEKGSWSVFGNRDLERITIEAECQPGQMFHLLVPSPEGMLPRAWEALNGTVSVLYQERQDVEAEWEPVFQGTSGNAGVEVGE